MIKLSDRSLELAYQRGAMSRGRFRRIAKALGWPAAKAVAFARRWKYGHKKGRRARAG